MIIGLIEHDGGTMAEASLQMLTWAREVVSRPDDEIAALLIGEGGRPLIDQLGRYGVSKAILAQDERLEDYAPAAWASTVVQVVANRRPRVFIAAGTDRGNEVIAHVSAQIDLPFASNCTAVETDDLSRVTRLRWGGSLLEEAVLTDDPKLLTVALHVVAPEEATNSLEPVLETFAPSLTEADFRVRVTRREETVRKGIGLKTAPVVVGGGRGVGSAEGYRVLEELANLLNGVVGGTRVATNNGWRPHSDQVGVTGARIAPELYIACGISGAIQHLVGCKGAKRILVINNDPEAAFFAKADYGVVGDLHEVAPAIIEELKKDLA
jgi:electron transfer flavoprotein alpha subunit